MEEFIKVMKALSDSSRIKIIKLLQRRNLCVCEIQEALKLSQSTVSKHLKILEKAGLVVSFREGQWVNHTLADGTNNPYVANLLGNLRYWLEEDSNIASLIERLPEIHRGKICAK
jgi:ArsR family transcriptional regulator